MDTMRFKEIHKIKYKCKCGHVVDILANETKVICSYCGKYVFKNKQDEFNYRLMEAMKNQNTKQKN